MKSISGGFSDREERIIKILGRKQMTFEEISKELFKGEAAPFDTSISVANSIRRIVMKCCFRNLDWTIEKSRQNRVLLIKKVKYNNR